MVAAAFPATVLSLAPCAWLQPPGARTPPSLASAAGAQVARAIRRSRAAGALGGRLDHTLANLNVLYMYPHLDMTLAGDGNLVRLLPRGRNALVWDPVCEGPTCALVPLAGPVVATSTGLRWNLQASEVRAPGGVGR